MVQASAIVLMLVLACPELAEGSSALSPVSRSLGIWALIIWLRPKAAL
jgi:hypothetical protein